MTRESGSGSVQDAPPQGLAKALIRSLTRGTAIAQGVRFIHVGHARWLAAQNELLGEVEADGHSETKFVRGAYGAGKSHFLAVVQDRARQLGWMTSHIECKVDSVQIDRFETLYPKLTSKLLSSAIIQETQSKPDGLRPDPLRFLLDKWTAQQLRLAGVKSEAITRPFDADNRLYVQFQEGLLRSDLPPEFCRALVAYSRASLARDVETTGAVRRWLGGTEEKCRIPASYLQRNVVNSSSSVTVEIRPIGRGSAHDVMRGLLWLIRSAGHAGLVLCIDEVEELAKLGSRRRQDQALQALREYVDHAGGEGGYLNLCMYLAATPDMFEGQDYFPRYDALATRIQPLGPEINWRAPVIDLDRTPLDPVQMREVAVRIWDVHRAAYGEVTHEFGEPFIDSLVEKLSESRLRMARPRLLARVVVDELERARQSGSAYKAPSDIDGVLGRTAATLVRESEQ
jgi:BREX system ATP-binding protein BrxC/D